MIKTHEPGATPLGHALRDLLLHRRDVGPTKRAELFLFLADRTQHVEEVIIPALKEEKIVLCDRFSDSTLSYQGAARSFDTEEIKEFCTFAAMGLVPDLTLLLDLDPKVGLARAQQRKGNIYDRLESEEMAFHAKVREAFLSLSEEEPDRFRVIDAMEPFATVFTCATEVIEVALCH